ncbi:MAG: LPS export ABC transporter periplasmic protein LptC [Spirochaetota bacterium]|nr:LPS export ABC transporter periplasmic protein LptC [Spirochaetota bacterium]
MKKNSITEVKKEALIILFIILINIYCGRSMPFEPISFRPDMRVRNYTSINYQKGDIVWDISATESCYYFNENRSIAEEIEMNYYKDGEKAALVNADRAIIYTDSKDMELIGNVDILSSKGHRLQTSKIRWNNLTKMLNTDEPIIIYRRNGDIIKGIGLIANYDLENYEIKRKVIAITERSIHNKNRENR